MKKWFKSVFHWCKDRIGKWPLWVRWSLTAALIIILFPIIFSGLLWCAAILPNWLGGSVITITDTYTIDFKSYLSVTVSMISCAVSATIAYNAFKLNKAVNILRESEKQSKFRYFITRLCIEIEQNIKITNDILYRFDATHKDKLNDEWFIRMDDYAPYLHDALYDVTENLVNMYGDFRNLRELEETYLTDTCSLKINTIEYMNTLDKLKKMIEVKHHEKTKLGKSKGE